MAQTQLNHSDSAQLWEVGVRADNALEAALLAIMGGRKLRSVTPSDSADIQLDGANGICRALICYGGNVAVVGADDVTTGNVTDITKAVTIPLSSTTMTLLPIHLRRVMATNTTATTIIAVF